MDSYFGMWRWGLFDFAEKRGIHIMPVHYYSPVPEISKTQIDDTKPRFLAANAAELDKALGLLRDICTRYPAEFKRIVQRRHVPGSTVNRFCLDQAPYSWGEAEVLYGLIRSRRPQRIIEIGCGHTTFLIAEAISDEARNNYAPVYQCVEPYRPDFLATPPSQVSEFIDKPLQTIPPNFFCDLDQGDILFIDSSHVVRYGSDCLYEILHLLPLLQPGVLVHFHDIFLPYDYPSRWLKESRFFWAEQYLLDAFLRGNRGFRIVVPMHQLFRERITEFEALFASGTNRSITPSAYWIERTPDIIQ